KDGGSGTAGDDVGDPGVGNDGVQIRHIAGGESDGVAAAGEIDGLGREKDVRRAVRRDVELAAVFYRNDASASELEVVVQEQNAAALDGDVAIERGAIADVHGTAILDFDGHAVEGIGRAEEERAALHVDLVHIEKAGGACGVLE